MRVLNTPELAAVSGAALLNLNLNLNLFSIVGKPPRHPKPTPVPKPSHCDHGTVTTPPPL